MQRPDLRSIEAAHTVEQRGLARAVRAYHRVERVREDLQIHGVQDGQTSETQRDVRCSQRSGHDAHRLRGRYDLTSRKPAEVDPPR